MKRAKKPSRTQKMIIDYYHLKPENRLLLEADPEKLCLVHRYTGAQRTIPVIEVSERSRKGIKK